jgi:hypothetical protein
VRIQNHVVIPGENRAVARGSREGDPGDSAARVSDVLLGRSFPPSESCKLHLLGPLPLAALRAARRGMTGGGTPPPYFRHSNASAFLGAQDVDTAGRYPPHYPKVRMGTLALGGVCLALGACTTPAPGDAVQTVDAAIRIVEKACGEKPIPGTRWRAFLEQDGWHVWIAAYAAHEESQADSVSVVSAKNGAVTCGPVVT